MMLLHPALISTVALVESVAKIAALLLGGAWAYYHYFRGRTYTSRLELGVAGEMFRHHDCDYVVATVRIRNVGLSKIPLDQEGTGLRVSSCEIPAESYGGVEWIVGRVFETFVHHAWIEPGEPIQERIITKVPAGLAVRLELRVVSGNQEWNTQEIIHTTSKDTYDRSLDMVRAFEETRITNKAFPLRQTMR